MTIIKIGHFTPIGMRVKIDDPKAIIINTCGQNDTAERGTFESWTWSNPTNRAIVHKYEDIEAVSVEALWQGTKIFVEGGRPDPQTLGGDWRRGKAKRPVGAYNGPNRPLLRSPGQARRRIYLPAFEALVSHWLQDATVQEWVARARAHEGDVYLRDHDTGRGVDRNGPMSHAWVLATYLNTGAFPIT